MKVIKTVNEFFIILPNTRIFVPETLNSFLLAFLKLANIKAITKQHVSETFGFPLNIVQTLFQRLIDYGLLEKNGSKGNEIYKITEDGIKRLHEGQIYFEEEIDVRLQVIDSPHFVLTHHWHVPPHMAEPPPDYLIGRISQPLLKERAQYSNLHEMIKTINSDPFVASIKPLELSFDLTENLPTQLFTRDRKGNVHPIRVKPDDPVILSLHSSLWECLNPDQRDETLKNAILNTSINTKICFKAEELTENKCIISIKFENENPSLKDHIAWVDWLKQVGWKLDSFRISFPIIEDWKISLDVNLEIIDEKILLGIFALYIVRDREVLHQLIRSYNFEDVLLNNWNKFQQKYRSNGIFDEEMLFEILWTLGTAGKVVAGRMIEKKVMKIGEIS